MAKVKPLASLTKLEQEKQSQKLANQLSEELEVLGQENERKAAKWVKEKGKEDVKIQDRKEANTLDRLDSSRNKIITYKGSLIEYAEREMRTFDIPKGFRWFVRGTKKGIVFWMLSPIGKWYARGMSVSGNPLFDLNSVTRFLFDGVDQMERLSGETAKEPNGIILP